MTERREMSPYEALANAIILQAVKDYRSSLRKLEKNSRNKDAASTATSIERFLRSRWYSILTDLDGEMLIRRIRDEFPDIDWSECNSVCCRRKMEKTADVL